MVLYRFDYFHGGAVDKEIDQLILLLKYIYIPDLLHSFFTV